MKTVVADDDVVVADPEIIRRMSIATSELAIRTEQDLETERSYS